MPRARRTLAAALSALAALAVIGCGDDPPPSASEQREAQQLLVAAVDAIDRERKVAYDVDASVTLDARHPNRGDQQVTIDGHGRYAAGGRFTYDGRVEVSDQKFDGIYMRDADLGAFAYDRAHDRWYGDEFTKVEPPEDGVRQQISAVLLSGYPASPEDRRSFAEPLDQLVKRVIDAYSGRVVDLSVEDSGRVDDTATVAVRLAPDPDAVIEVMRRRGTREARFEGPIKAVVAQLQPEVLLGVDDHLPRLIRLDASVEDGLEPLGDDGIKRIDIELSIRLFDWGEDFRIEPPEHFRPLAEFQPIYLG